MVGRDSVAADVLYDYTGEPWGGCFFHDALMTLKELFLLVEEGKIRSPNKLQLWLQRRPRMLARVNRKMLFELLCSEASVMRGDGVFCTMFFGEQESQGDVYVLMPEEDEEGWELVARMPEMEERAGVRVRMQILEEGEEGGVVSLRASFKVALSE